MNALDQLSSLSDAALDSHVVQLAANERSSTVDVLWGLVALERRHNAAGLGFRVWTYCHERLLKPESTASRYTAAAKLLGQFPAAEPFLRDGRLNPTTFTALEDVLTEANHRELFERASGLSQKQIAILLAELQPKPDVEESMRFVPERSPRPMKPTPTAAVARSETPAPDSARSTDLFEVARTAAAEVERRHGLTVTATITTGDFTSLLPKDPPPRCKAKLKPLRKGHYVLEINCDQQFADELEDLRMALTHVFPKADLGDAIREAVGRTLRDVQRRKYGLRSSKKVERGEEAVATAGVAPASGGSPGTESRTSVAEVVPVQSRNSLAAESRTSVSEVTPVDSRTSIVESEPVESTTSLPLSQCRSSESTSTAEVAPDPVARPSDAPEESIPLRLLNALFFQTDAAQFVPPWLRSIRSLPAEVKRVVYERDGGCCSFVGSTGHRCSSKYRLEYDHWMPYARGGEATVDNIRLLCRHHNIFCAVQTYGVEVMSRYVRVY